MHKEYAVEPKAIGSSWQNFRYLIEKFGFDKGRLISQFPKKWARMVIEESYNLPDMQKAKIVERLRSVKKTSLIKSGRDYDPSLDDWLINAITQQEIDPFHAIISANECEHAGVVCIDALDGGHELVVRQPIKRVKRTGQDIADAMATLLREANTILFVDPYLDISNAENRETLKSCLEVIASNISPHQKCEVHFGHMDRLGSSTDMIEANFDQWLDSVLPDGVSVVFYNWKKKYRGEDFHARYLLTEKGGLSIDAGFRARGDHETVDISLLNQDFCEARLNDFKRDATVYELVDPVVEVFSDGQVK